MASPLTSLAQIVSRKIHSTPPPAAPLSTQPAAAPADGSGGDSGSFDMLSNPQAYAEMLTRNGAPASYVISRVQGLMDYQKELAGLNSSQLEQQKTKYALAGNAMVGYAENPTDENWALAKQLVAEHAPDIEKHMEAFQSRPTEAQLGPLIAMTGGHAKLLENAETTAKTNEAQANANKAQAGVAGETADSETKQFKLDLLKHAANGTTPDFGATVKGMSVFGGHPQEAQDAADAGSAAYKAALASGDPLKAATDANTAISSVADRLRAVSPGVVAGEAGKAKATAQATLPVEQAKQQYQNALQQGDKATADYASTIADSRQTTATAQTIHKVIDLAQADNATAGAQLKALIPEFTNAIHDIKRPGNAQSSEISSTLEKAIGEIESVRGLSPVTAKALAGIRPYVDTVANGAVTRANTAIDATNTAYGKKFAHETLPVQYQHNPQTGQIIVTRDGGATWADSKTGAPVK